MSEQSPAVLDADRFAGVDPDDLDEQERREYRAHTEAMLVVPEVDPDGDSTGLYRVFSESGSRYTVDLLDGRCNCPDVKHNDPPECKHEIRVAAMAANRSLPAPGQFAADYWASLEAEAADLRERKDALLDRVHALTAMLGAVEEMQEQRAFATDE